MQKNILLVIVLSLIFNMGFAQNYHRNDSVYIKINDSITRAYRPTRLTYFLNGKEVPEYQIEKMLFEGKKIGGFGYEDKRGAIRTYGEKFRQGVLFLDFDGETNENGDFFNLTGRIDNRFDNKIITLFTFGNNNILTADTTIIRNGTFHFYGKEYKDEFSLLSVGNWPEDEVRSLDVILEKDAINVNMFDSNERIGGTLLNDLYQSFFDSTAIYQAELKKIASEQGNEQVTAGSPLEKKFEELGYFSVNFKKENISNIVGQKIFQDNQENYAELIAYGNGTAFQIIIDSAPEEYKNNNKEWIEQTYERLRKVGASSDEQNKLLNTVYTDFEFQTIDGENKRLSDYIGKSIYVLLDFWASWCAPCIADMPYLKEIYEKYKDKGFEIISISLDNSKRAWQRGLDKIDVPWIHLSDLKGSKSEMANAYKINGIPYLLIIDKTGKIIEVNLRGKSLDDFLKQVFANF